MSSRVLFIGNDASRSGAPTVLLNLLRWLKANTEIEAHILLRNDGPLRAEFEALGPTTCWKDIQTRRSLVQRAVNRFGLTYEARRHPERALRALYGKLGLDLIYSNTVTNGELLEGLSFLPCPVICHVHELEHLIRKYGDANLEAVKRRAVHYIAVSNSVKANLTDTHGIPDERITVAPAFPDLAALSKRPKVGEELCARIGAPEGAFIVGGSGGPNWTKGRDLFVQLALATRQLAPDLAVHFVWIGGATDGLEFHRVRHDTTRAGVGDRLHWLDNLDDPIPLYDGLSAFALTSREDSCPLAALEAASLGKPILCFDKSGGMPEFVEEDAGFVVPYLDVRTMAQAIVRLARDPALRRRLGDRASVKVLERHDVRVIGPRVFEVMRRLAPALQGAIRRHAEMP